MHIKPVFIFGCQRSGTTMLASQAGAGTSCIAFPEMQFVIWLVSRNFRAGNSAEQAYQRLINDFRFRASGLIVEREEFISLYSKDDLAALVFYLVRSNLPAEKQSDTVYWFEHNPESRGYVELLMEVFPEALFLHCVRDPRAVYLSMRDNPRWEVSEPLKLSGIWSDAVAKGYLYGSKYPDRVLTVRYEDYVTNARKCLAGICDFLGIPFEEKMLQGGGVKLPAFTQQQHKKTLGPPVSDHKNRWQNLLSDREVNVINHQCYDWMLHYGYLEGEKSGLRIRYYDKLLYGIIGGFAKLRSKLTVMYQNRVH